MANDYANQYNTALKPDQERAFWKWAKQAGREYDVEDYDLRGAWLELQKGDMTEADNGHLGDKYKKPNHPTFSDESIYNGADGHYGGHWVDRGNGRYAFEAGETQKRLWEPEALQRYFKDVEPDVELVLPKPTALSNAGR